MLCRRHRYRHYPGRSADEEKGKTGQEEESGELKPGKSELNDEGPGLHGMDKTEAVNETHLGSSPLEGNKADNPAYIAGKPHFRVWWGVESEGREELITLRCGY